MRVSGAGATLPYVLVVLLVLQTANGLDIADLTCPPNTIDVSDNTDLSTLKYTADATFNLTGSSYTIFNSSVTVPAGKTFCFVGQQAAVHIGVPRVYGFMANGQLGLSGLVVEGNTSVTQGQWGVYVSQGSLSADEITLQGCGFGVTVTDGQVVMKRSSFKSNHWQGMYAQNSRCSLEETTCQDNNGASCLCLNAYNSNVTFSGNTRFTNNTAATAGGALCVIGSSIVRFVGILCSQGNTAPVGAFALLSDNAQLQLDATTSHQGGLTNDIALRPEGSASVRCSNSKSVWPNNPVNYGDSKFAYRTYNVTGDMCECNEGFTTQNLTTCGECGALGWDTDMCSCKGDNPQCSSGRCCDADTQTFKPASTPCRSAKNSCDVAEYCTGESATCPGDETKPDGASCTRMVPFHGKHNRKHLGRDPYYSNYAELAGANSVGGEDDSTHVGNTGERSEGVEADDTLTVTAPASASASADDDDDDEEPLDTAVDSQAYYDSYGHMDHHHQDPVKLVKFCSGICEAGKCVQLHKHC